MVQKNKILPLDIINKNIKKGDSCLDLGCGESPLGKDLLKKGLEVHFLDKDKKKLNYLKNNLKEGKFKIIHKDILKYKNKKKFNIILLKGVLNFIEEKDLPIIFGILNKNIKKEGIAYISWLNDFPKNKSIIKLNFLKKILEEYNFKILYKKSFNKIDLEKHIHNISSIIARKI